MARITEVFHSIQGEGVLVGVPQIFIRFSGCNLTCRYCDVSPNLPVRKFTVRELVRLITALNKSAGPVHSVSLTGGEPLLQADFLKDFLPVLKKKELKVYLETNGTLPEELKKIGRWCDFVALDIKLPGATGGKPLWEVHRDFLKEALVFCPVPRTFVKAVVTGQTLSEDVERAARLIRGINAEITLVIQPAVTNTNAVNPLGKTLAVPDSQKLLEFLQLAQKFLPSVRLIPPIHQILNLP